MPEQPLANCRCGSKASYVYDEGGVFVRCEDPDCRIRTPVKTADISISAVDTVSNIWNKGATMWPRWIKPAVPTDGYPFGAGVSHDTGLDKDWPWEHWTCIKEDGLNVHEPGVSGWRLVGPAPKPIT